MDLSTRPSATSNAVKLLYLSLILSIVFGIIFIATGHEIKNLPEHISVTQFMLIAIVSLAVVSLIKYWFIRMIGGGRNWARIIYLIIVILGLLAMGSHIHSLINQGTLYIISSIITTVIDICAVFLLFTSASNAWFSGKKSAE